MELSRAIRPRPLGVSWHDLDQAIDLLTNRLRPKVVSTYGWVVTGEPRGGLVLAVCLSHQLGLPLASGLWATIERHNRVIWVDDILDTGQTLSKAKAVYLGMRELLPCFWVARESWRDRDYLVATYVPENRWIVFPWEVRNESCTRT